MPTPFESAQLNLKLFELRREPALREARLWFLRDFNPANLEEAAALAGGARNESFRMVLSYWDMAASLVSAGAIDAESFLAAHGEITATFAKIYPFLAEFRALTGEPDACRHIEHVVMTLPDAVAAMGRRYGKARAAAEQAKAEAKPNT